LDSVIFPSQALQDLLIEQPGLTVDLQLYRHVRAYFLHLLWLCQIFTDIDEEKV
jgi:hypothetical protein